MALLELLLFIIISLSFGYLSLGPRVWAPLYLALLTVYSLFSHLPFLVMAALWVLSAPIMMVTLLPVLRRRYLTKPLFKYFKAQLPPMGETEKIALEAGDVWWDRALFSGNPDWAELIHFPAPSLTQEEQRFLDNEVEELCEMLDDWQIVHELQDLPEPVWAFIKEKGFMGLEIPTNYGGKGFSAQLHSAVVAKVSSRSSSAAVTVMVPNSLGPGELLLNYGTEGQKEQYLPKLAKGQEIPCFGLTGLDAGSDAASMTDVGIVCEQEFEGKRVLGIKLNFYKRYITLAPRATVIGLAFKLYDPDQLLKRGTSLGITVCLIPGDHPGVEKGQRHSPMNLAFLNGPIRGKDVFIPMDWIIGGEEMIGEGWRMLMECLSVGRSISLPSLSAANGQLCFRTTGAYAQIRKQFKLPIHKFDGVGESLAQIAGLTYQLEACRVLTSAAVDQEIRPALISAIAKYHMTEMSREIINHAMDIHGGRAIQQGPRNYLAFPYQAIPIGITVEGANILMRSLVIYGQGAIRCHPFIYKEMQTVEMDEKEGLKAFDKLLISHIGFVFTNFARTVLLGLVNRMAPAPVAGPVARYYRQMSRMSAVLALASDVTVGILGGKIKRLERLSARLGDMLSHLYLGSTVLKYFHDHNSPADHEAFVHWTMQRNLYYAQEAFYGFCKNFPNGLVGNLLKWCAFPRGRSFKLPSDRLESQLVDAMVQPSELREQLTRLCFIGGVDEPVGLVDTAMQQTLKLSPIIEKFQQSMKLDTIAAKPTIAEKLAAAVGEGVLTEQESSQLAAYEQLRVQALDVDEF